MEEQKINKKITFSIVAVLLIVLVTIGATYAYFSAQAQTDVQTVTTGTLTMGFESGDIVNATGITPINDSEIKTKATSLPFSVTNTGNQHTKITIELTDITIDDALKDVDFRWGLYNADTDKGVSFGILKNAETGGKELLLRDVILDKGSATKNYVLRIWIHDDGALQNEMQGKTFSGKVVVTGEAVEYTPETCFTFKNGAITGYDYLTCGEDVVIPKTIGGVAVTGITFPAQEDRNENDYGAPDYYLGAFSISGLKSVIIPDGVTTITSSFYNSGIKNLTIPESVTSIENAAFVGVSLDFIAIPESPILMGGESFTNITTSTVVVPGTVNMQGYGFNGASINDIILMEGITSLSNYNFESSNISTLEIPNSVTTISNGQFQSCSNLTEIIVRGKSSLSDFTDSTGLTTAGGLPEGVNIIFRP